MFKKNHEMHEYERQDWENHEMHEYECQDWEIMKCTNMNACAHSFGHI